jgi:hypothetical protein
LLEPKDDRLFHYTPRLEFLKDMLANGIWPRYCDEEFEWLLEKRVYLTLPTACFCDIPLHAASYHKARYGDYAIGFSKELATKYNINPVWYCQEDTNIVHHLKGVFYDLRRSLNGIPEKWQKLLPFLKATWGFQDDREAIYRSSEFLRFEEELEWRHTPFELMNTWHHSYVREEVQEECHDQSGAYRIQLSIADISEVFVTNTREVAEITNEFPALSGRVSCWGGRSLAP